MEREQVLKYFESLTQISIEERDGEMELRGGKLVEAEKTCGWKAEWRKGAAVGGGWKKHWTTLKVGQMEPHNQTFF